MKVEDNRKYSITVGDAEIGSVFDDGTKIYIKTSSTNEARRIECVLLETGEIYMFCPTSLVTPINAKVVIE